MLLQVSPVAVAGTVGSLALFLSLTAHVAARNVLGDVQARKAVGVGPLPAAIAVLFATFDLPAFVGIALAVAVDGAAIHYLYEQERRLSAYILFVHVVVSIILGAVLVSAYLVALSAPG